MKTSLNVRVIIFAFTCTYKSRNYVFLVLEKYLVQEDKDEVFGDLKPAVKNMDKTQDRNEDRGH